MTWLGFDFGQMLQHAIKICIAYAMAVPIGWERQQDDRSAGLRTFPLVSIASCAYMLLAADVGFAAADTARVLVGVMTGIGFIGGGAILKYGVTVRGTATAASLWNMGAVGASVSRGHYELAVLLSFINFLSLRLLTPFERRWGKKKLDE
ncbi:MAG: MgtC/SapB family protein [Bryobacteraceae bacterium]